MRYSLLGVLILLFFCLHFTHCANVVPPLGGPRDSIPPKLIFSNPKDLALNVNSKKIDLYFDEYIAIEKINTNLIISPYFINQPIFEPRLKKLSIILKDSLIPNTTYSFNFNRAIKDINEGNVLNKIILRFSTGDKMDFNTYKGKVMLAETGSIDSTLIVILHRENVDSAIYLKSPNYYTNIDNKGNFEFYSLPKGRFNAFVLPNNFLKKYNDTTALFAFLEHPVIIDSPTKMDTFYAYSSPKPLKKSIAPKLNPKSKPIPLSYTTNLEANSQDVLKKLELTFNKKIILNDSNGLILYDTSFNVKSNYIFSLDTNTNQLFLSYDWKPNQFYKAILKKQCVLDTSNQQLSKSDTLSFSTFPESRYGKLVLKLKQIDTSLHYLLQVVHGGKIYYQQKLSKKMITIPRIYPNNYELRFVEDKNDNNQWDKGIYTKDRKQLPEKTFLYSKKVEVKPDWDNIYDIDL